MSDDIADEVNILDPNPMAEHDEWEQAIKDDGTLKSVNERYRVRQSPAGVTSVWCGTCNEPVFTINTFDLDHLLEIAKEHEAEVHS